MKLNELTGKYTRLRDEIGSLEGAGKPSEAWLARLTCELDQIQQELIAFRRLARAAPTLQDVVPWVRPFAPDQRGNGQRASAD